MVTAKEMGAKGGSARSEAKTAAARKNARKNAGKPRSKWITWANFGVIGADGKEHHGHLLWLKNFDFSEKNGPELHAAIDEFFRERGQAHRVLPFKDIIEMSGSARKLDGWRLPSIAECLSRKA